MLPSPTDTFPPDYIAVPPPAVAAPAPGRVPSPGLPRVSPVALAGAVPLPGLEPWTCFGRLA